jgi:hypothetical protein
VAAAAVVSGEGCLANAAAAASVPARATLVPLCIATPLKAATTVFFLFTYNLNCKLLIFSRTSQSSGNTRQEDIEEPKSLTNLVFFLNFLLQFIYFLMQ